MPIAQDVVGVGGLVGGVIVLWRMVVHSSKAVERDAMHMEQRYKNRLDDQDEQIADLKAEAESCRMREAYLLEEQARLRVALIEAGIPVPPAPPRRPE